MAMRIPVVLWRIGSWRCELSFAAEQTRVRLFENEVLITDQIAVAGLDAWQQANAWKTAVAQVLKPSEA
jgi:hypothetical protein